MSIIRVSNLVKEFRRPTRATGRLAVARSLVRREYTTVRPVEDVSFDIAPGEFVGYIGANGAGKSTTIRMLTGVLVPTAGTVEVAGLTPWRERQRNAMNIGVVFGQRTGLWWELPLRDSLWLVRRIYDVPCTEFETVLAEFSELLGLDEFMDTPVRQLSLGQRMRGELAAAMLHRPKVLFLDEPTIGLDVLARQRIREFLLKLNSTIGTTIVLTTHDLGDIEELCPRVILIDHGTLIYDGGVEELKDRYAPYRDLVFDCDDPTDIADIAGVEPIPSSEGQMTLRFDPKSTSSAELINQVVSRYDVSDISIVEPNLEGVVRDIYRAGPVRG